MSIQENYHFSCKNSDMNINAIHDYLSQSYWAKGIPLETVERAVKNSLCFGVFHQQKQIGFARVITDQATFGYLADVYILAEHRGQTLSKKLMTLILEHPQLQCLRRMVLATADAHTLYQKFGFKSLANPETFMEIWQPKIYQSNL